MKNIKPDIKDYYVPMKKEIPTLHYDVAVFCDIIKHIVPVPIPDYLDNYRSLVISYSKQLKKVKPKQFPNGYRVYIMDARLNLLFATIDITGKIATCFSKYGKFAHSLEDYCYGDGKLIGDVWPPGTGHDVNEMREFKKYFGFLPIEELAMSSALVYGGEDILERRMLSQYQVCVLMSKYSRNNFIDWKQRVNEVSDEYRF